MPNGTEVGTPTIVARTALVTVVSPYIGDDNANNTARLQWRVAGTGVWLDAFPMYLERANRRWQGVIYDLQPSTDYEVRVEYSDPDGATAPWAGVVRTKDDGTVPLGTGPVLVVSPTGDDTFTGSEGNPLRTITKAASLITAPGTTILIRGDPATPYLEQVNFLPTVSRGALGNPITFQAWPGETPVIDGQFTRSLGFQIGLYGRVLTDVVLRGLRVRNTAGSNIRWEYSQYCTIEDCILEEARRSAGDNAHLEMRGKYLTFRRNEVINLGAVIPALPAWKTDVQGINLWGDTGGLHSIYNNIFRGAHYDDAVRTYREGSASNGWVRDSEFYGNRIEEPNDDGWQFEGGVARVVGWRNRIIRPRMSAIAVAPVIAGPTYLFRNLVLDDNPATVSVAMKTGGGSVGKLFVVHNSFIGNLYGPSRYGGAGWTNHEYYNNLIWSRRYCYWGLEAGNRFDYNALYTSEPGWPSLVDCSTGYLGGLKATSLAQWQAASGQDFNSVGAVLGNPLINPSTGEVLPGSPVVDRAFYFPGWSAPFQGSAPDIGALESGETAATYSLTTAVQGEGSIEPSGGNFPQGIQINVVATAAPGWGFDHWEGDASGTYPNILLAMDGNKSITAVFVQLPALLSIEVQGSGTTDPAPVLNQPFPVGTQVSITAIPAQGWKLDRWELGASGFDLTITVLMDTSKTVRAVFVPITHTVSISITVGGTTEPMPGPTVYNEGEEAILTALPDGGYYFVEWREGGVTVSTSNPYIFVVLADRQLEAVFALIPLPPDKYAVTITVIGQGATDPPPDVYEIDKGAVLTVLATAAQGWRFDHWEYGLTTASTNPLVVQVNESLSILAVFVAVPPSRPISLPVVAVAIGAGLLLLTSLGRGKR